MTKPLRFVSNGIPVMMDEFGALDKNGNLQDRVNFTAYYVASASARGITCVWWDNGCYFSGNELFGIYDRSNCKWFSPSVADAVIKASEK